MKLKILILAFAVWIACAAGCGKKTAADTSTPANAKEATISTSPQASKDAAAKADDKKAKQDEKKSDQAAKKDKKKSDKTSEQSSKDKKKAENKTESKSSGNTDEKTPASGSEGGTGAIDDAEAAMDVETQEDATADFETPEIDIPVNTEPSKEDKKDTKDKKDQQKPEDKTSAETDGREGAYMDEEGNIVLPEVDLN